MFQVFIKRSKHLLCFGIIAGLLFVLFAASPAAVSAKDKKTSSAEVESLVGTQFTDSRISYEITYDATDTEPGTVKIIGNNLKKKTTTLFLPTYITYQGNDYSVTTIGEYAFVNSHIKKLQINSRVFYIEKYAFAMSDLTEAKLPYSTYRIGEGAFAMCTSLEKVYIGPDVARLKKSLINYGLEVSSNQVIKFNDLTND